MCLCSGKRVPPPRPSQSNPDYVQCPYCARRFEEYAAERHVPFCKERHSRIERRPQENKAMEKLNKRIQVCVCLFMLCVSTCMYTSLWAAYGKQQESNRIPTTLTLIHRNRHKRAQNENKAGHWMPSLVAVGFYG